MADHLRSYRNNPLVFVRLPRAHWLIVQRMAVTRGARHGDVIREAVASAVAGVDASSLAHRARVNPLRQPVRWIRTQAYETRPYRWLRRLRLAAQAKANGRVCSIEIRNAHMGFFAHMNFCLAIFQYCERHGLRPQVRCTSPNYADPRRGPDLLEYYFDKPPAAMANPGKVKYTTLTNDVKNLALGIRPDTTLEDARRLFRRHLVVKPHIVEMVERCWENVGGQGPVVGVHYRGTDKSLESPRVSLAHCLGVTRRYITQNPNTTAVFVASDEQRFVDGFKEAITELPVFSRDDHYRSCNLEPIHNYRFGGGGYEKGEDALVNALLLSKCTALIRTTSLLSAWASVFKPDIKVILLNMAYDNRTWYPETEIIRQANTEYCPDAVG